MRKLCILNLRNKAFLVSYLIKVIAYHELTPPTKMNKQMTITNESVSYASLNNQLAQQQIGLTAAELHGLVSGILCGGNQDNSWLTLVYNLTNEGMAFSSPLSQYLKQVHDDTEIRLEEDGFTFQMLMPDGDDASIFERADALAGWVNHFLLGLGVMQPKMDKIKGDVGEVIDDLRTIGQLGYDEDEDREQLEQDLEEVSEYVRMAAMLCYNEFNRAPSTAVDPQQTPTLH